MGIHLKDWLPGTVPDQGEVSSGAIEKQDMNYCKDCESVLMHAYNAEVDLPGRWESGPNVRMHYREHLRPSRKYPSGLSVYYLCGRRPMANPGMFHVEREHMFDGVFLPSSPQRWLP